jgi:osmoprotectant transport system permease protein
VLTRSPDRVALTGAVLALVSALMLPAGTLRPNRLAQGDPHSWLAAGAILAVPMLALLLAVFASFLCSRSLRGHVLSSAGVLLIGGIALSLGALSESLMVDAPSIARVSIGSGTWLMLAGAAIVAFSGWQALMGKESASQGTHVRMVYPLATAAFLFAAVAFGGLDTISLAAEYGIRTAVFWPSVIAHLRLAGVSLVLGLAMGVPLGIIAARDARIRRVALGVTGIIQTIPSLAMLGLLIAPLAALSAAYPVLRQLGIRGIGETPAMIALTLYALLPIVRNTYVGLAEVDPAVVDAGRGMGMSRGQLLWRVEMPLALPLVLEGVRAGAVLLVGITAVTALVGARNLGSFIFEGLGQAAPDLILLGALPIIVLAIVADVGLSFIADAVTPKGVRAA